MSPASFSRGSGLSDWKMRKRIEGLCEKEREMNRWSYQSVLRLVFNLDTEREHEMKRGRELHYISHSRWNVTVEPLASPTVAHRCFGVLDVVQRFLLGCIHTEELMFSCRIISANLHLKIEFLICTQGLSPNGNNEERIQGGKKMLLNVWLYLVDAWLKSWL